MKCDVCGFEETESEKFVGIFTLGQPFSSTTREPCYLYGCPKCNVVKFTNDLNYVKLRKREWKGNNC